MADDTKQASETTTEAAAGQAQDTELWDWVRTAGVSREDLLRALELSPPR